MGCGSCGSGGGCSSGGCGQKGGCATGGCNKLNTYDWLGNMLGPDQTEVDNIYEIRFKNTRKEFFRNVNGLRLYIGDQVIVESDRGYDVGILSLGGITAELQMKRKGIKTPREKLLRIYRKANESDDELLKEVRAKEPETLSRSRTLIQDLKLDMKLSDVEFQADNAKAIFYYIADHRVDFRELIKILAREFRIRVEMKQIGLRHEAGLVGGIGSCGRELCCSTWLTEFKTVSTAAARYQNLSLNPMKISGLCGRLKCCLNFELDAYMDAIQSFPKVDRIETKKGKAILQKTDIFKGKMWFSFLGETNWYPLDTEEVKQIIALNEKGEKPEVFGPGGTQVAREEEKRKRERTQETFDFVDVVGTNVPEPEKRNPRRKNRKGRKPNPQNRNQNQRREKKAGAESGGAENSGAENSGAEKSGAEKKQAPRNRRGPRRNKPRTEGGEQGAKEEGKSGEKRSSNQNNRNRKSNSRRKPRPPRNQGGKDGNQPPNKPASE